MHVGFLSSLGGCRHEPLNPKETPSYLTPSQEFANVVLLYMESGGVPWSRGAENYLKQGV